MFYHQPINLIQLMFFKVYVKIIVIRLINSAYG